MANTRFTQFFYTKHAMPVLIDCNFVVDVANGNGLGIRSLKGSGVNNVYMHTSATPATGNPNPASGTIVVQLTDNYFRSFGGFNAIVSPVSGSALKIDNSALTAGVAYIISTLGDATAAAWHLLGVPAGVTPAVGVAFIAASVGAGGNTSSSRVMAAAATGSGVAMIETVGDPNTTLSPVPSANQGYGGQIILQCHDYAGAIVAPADNSVIALALYLSNSSVVVAGE